MKKLALTIVCALAMSGAAFAQGWASFVTSFTAVTAQTNTAFSPLFGGSGIGGTVGGTSTAANGLAYEYTLLYQPFNGSIATDTHVWDGAWINTGLTASNSTVAGRMAANASSSGNQQLPWANGVSNSIVLVGWSANMGNSWLAVSNILGEIALTPALAQAILIANGVVGDAFFGETVFGYINPNLSQPGAVMFNNGTTPNGSPIFSLNTQLYSLIPVPEPATLALAGLGGLGLLLFRRRKS